MCRDGRKMNFPKLSRLVSLPLTFGYCVRPILKITLGLSRSKTTHTMEGQIDKLTQEWMRTQAELKLKLVLKDTEEWQKRKEVARKDEDSELDNIAETESSEMVEHQDEPTPDSALVSRTEGKSEDSFLTRVGGVDISYDKKNTQRACVTLVIIQLPCLKVIYEDLTPVEVTVPYVPGYLAFREVDFYVKAVNKLKSVAPQFFPQVVLVDGNGILHPNEFGLACQLGVLLDVPCIGVAKNLHILPNTRIQRDADHQKQIDALLTTGDTFSLLGHEGNVLAKAVKTCSLAKKPVYVSVGHKCSLDTAVWVTLSCSLCRVPEPIRQADIRSREYLRKCASDDDPENKVDISTLNLN